VPGSPDQILSRLEGLGIKLGLEKTRSLLAALGDPQLRYPCVLVAGTNGKGSVSALLASMAKAAGYKTGLYTSPHLETVEERLRIGGESIPPERFARLLHELIALSETTEGTLPTYFEAVTLAAFQWFAAEKVDLAVVEVGLGGRLDATNLCEPLLSVITSIGFDHQEYLGNTLDSIAREKAGILRKGRKALVWIEAEEPANAVREEAEEKGAELHFVQGEVEVERAEALGWRGARYRLRTETERYDLEVALLGQHQVHNLGLAVRAAEELAKAGFDRIGREAIEKGAASCRWPGRLEMVELGDGRRVLLDAAHNGAGAATLGEFVANQRENATFLFGVLADKDIDEMLRHLLPHAKAWVLTTPPNPRALAPDEVARKIRDAGLGVAIEVEPEPEKALDAALARTGAGGLLVACGSIYLLGEIRAGVEERFGRPAPAAGPLF
jgi:dihydrofolate synthase/folylpolyglutamate synthase